MKYRHVVQASFLDRPNRFTARVLLDGQKETVHVKNTGRCRELLIPGSPVFLAEAENPARKTRYDLIAVRKTGGTLFNIDSQAPNAAVKEWLDRQGFDRVIPEYAWGASRLDFYMRRGADEYLMEVKGCTLESGGKGWFPDAPTARGAKHLRELAAAAAEGYRAVLAFVIQTDGITEVLPNRKTDPAFGQALDQAVEAGVRILYLPCHVEPDSMEIAGGSI